MDSKSFTLGADVHAYIVAHGTPPDALQRELIEETRKLGGISLMQIAPEQGAFMTLLTRAIGARTELGPLPLPVLADGLKANDPPATAKEN